MKAFNTAAVAAAEAAWNAQQVHKVGEVPASPATPYTVLSVTSGRPENYRTHGKHGSKSYRIVAQMVGRTYDEVAFAVEKTDAAFEDKRLTGVTGYDCGPCVGDERVASPVIRDPDGGVLLSCTVLYPFDAYPTS